MVEVSGIGIYDPKPLDEYWDKIFSLRRKNFCFIWISYQSYSYARKDEARIIRNNEKNEEYYIYLEILKT
uniref:ATP-binding protein n=1 Tax=Strongyloides venezuelensis TaxID=75913 RepID=A0A0K0FIV7_STRVS